MSLVQYRKGDVFGCGIGTNRTVLAHSCNCRGQWGAGIALAVARAYPRSYEEYRKHCESYGDHLLGSYILTSDNILCLFTSRGYGRQVDNPGLIEKSTYLALQAFMSTYEQVSIAMPKINSGLFRVPWHKTESILNQLLNENAMRNHSIIVWEQ